MSKVSYVNLKTELLEQPMQCRAKHVEVTSISFQLTAVCGLVLWVVLNLV